MLWCPVRRCAGKNKRWDLPIAGIELNALGNRFGRLLLLLLGLAVAGVLGDVNLVVVLRRLGAATVLVDADLFLDVGVVGRLLLLGRRRVVVVVDGGSREGFVCLFVTFPSVCSRFRKGSFSFYLWWCGLLGRRVSIRRREDTEGDRNLEAVSRGCRGHWRRRRGVAYSCFKIQFAGVPFEPFENNSKGFRVSLGELGKKKAMPKG